MVTNCVNCGAPIKRDRKECPYCDTPYDVSGFNAEIEKMFGKITIGGETYKVYLGSVECNQVFEDSYMDMNGFLHRTHIKTLHKFTLIEV